MLNDFTPWPSAILDEFRTAGDKPDVRWKPPSIIYLVNASIEQRNRFFGAVYGGEHIPERGNARALSIELDGRREVLYTPDVVHMAFEAMVRNFIDLAGEGIGGRQWQLWRKLGWGL